MAGPSVRAQFERFGGIYRWILLFTMLTGSMATMLAATTINVALPAIIGATDAVDTVGEFVPVGFFLAQRFEAVRLDQAGEHLLHGKIGITTGIRRR